MICENTAVVAEWLPAAMLGSLATYVKISVTSRFDRLMLYHNTVLESWSIFPALVPFPVSFNILSSFYGLPDSALLPPPSAPLSSRL